MINFYNTVLIFYKNINWKNTLNNIYYSLKIENKWDYLIILVNLLILKVGIIKLGKMKF